MIQHQDNQIENGAKRDVIPGPARLGFYTSFSVYVIVDFCQRLVI